MFMAIGICQQLTLNINSTFNLILNHNRVQLVKMDVLDQPVLLVKEVNLV